MCVCVCVYRQQRAYIATQGPLAETTEDYWRMLWEHNSTIVVMLTKLREMGRVWTHTSTHTHPHTHTHTHPHTYRLTMTISLTEKGSASTRLWLRDRQAHTHACTHKPKCTCIHWNPYVATKFFINTGYNTMYYIVPCIIVCLLTGAPPAGEVSPVLASWALSTIPVLCGGPNGRVQHAPVHPSRVQSHWCQGECVCCVSVCVCDRMLCSIDFNTNWKMCLFQDGQSRTVRQFQFTDWPEQGVPKSGEGFIDFIGQVHKTKEQFGQDGPITVHCR